MKTIKPIKTLLWIIMLVLTLHLVTALGITPSRTTLVIDEWEGPEFKEFSGEFLVINRAQVFTLKVSVEGEMAKYIDLNATELYFREDDSALPVQFKIKVPKNLPPGEVTAYIVVEQDPENKKPLAIAARAVLRHKIIIVGPYPDKYVKIKLNFREDHDKIKLISEVENLGKENIDQVKTTFYVNDKEQKQHILETETTSLNIKENKVLITELDRNLFELGEWEVLAITQYDGEQQESRSKMVLSQPEIDAELLEAEIVTEKEFEPLELTPPGPLTGKITVQPEKEPALTSILFWILVGVMLIIIASYVIYRYIHRNEYEGGDQEPL